MMNRMLMTDLDEDELIEAMAVGLISDDCYC